MTTTAVELSTRHDFSLATTALEQRAEKLKKLAKSALEEGYPREARTFEADVQAIRESILPKFADQQELPLATPEDVRAGIGASLRGIVRAALAGLHADGGDDEINDDEINADAGLRMRENEAVDRLAARIEHYAHRLAVDAFGAGLAARDHDPVLFCHGALGALREEA